MGTWLVGWLVNWFNSQLVGVRVTVRVDVPGHRGAADCAATAYHGSCSAILSFPHLGLQSGGLAPTLFKSSDGEHPVCAARGSYHEGVSTCLAAVQSALGLVLHVPGVGCGQASSCVCPKQTFHTGLEAVLEVAARICCSCNHDRL